MFNWRELPIVRPFLALAVGILLALRFDYNHLWLQFTPLLALLLYFPEGRLRRHFRYQSVTGVVIYLFFIAFGHQLTMLHGERSRQDYLGGRLGEQNLLIGTISEAPNLKPEWVKVQLRSQFLGNTQDDLRRCSGTLLLYLERDSAAELLTYGTNS